MSDALKGISINEAIGRKILCDDGISRVVENIVHSFRYRDRAIVNETDPECETGQFVHLLSLACQLIGKPLPTEEEKYHFSKVANAFDVAPAGSRVGWVPRQSGLVVRH